MTKRQQCMYINNKQDYDIRKLGVWNIRSLTGKEDEMVYEFNKTALDILVIPETKKKGTGEIDITDGHRLLYSGVPQMNRAAGGIACLVHRRLLQSIITWKGWSERILTVEFLIGGEILTIIAVYGPNENEKKEITETSKAVYGPNENEKKEVKDKFWNDLTKITETSNGKGFGSSN
ncbi:hypothetical protein QE152_g19576 [Popillia japonica]|uniref:Uncharacterized protein n=1 Tax=Popillia japonica TaxID=7064 RepID=A0AAW1KNL5_POPJA